MSGLQQATDLLSALIATPSISREEKGSADILENRLKDNGVAVFRTKNNVWALSEHFDNKKPTLLLNSHHDTVRPSSAYTRNPFLPYVKGGKLFGLGSNDAGASLVSILSTFEKHYKKKHNFNIIMALTAEEEVGGENGIRCLLPIFDRAGYKIDMAIVGEPTDLQPAIGERGLIVLDCVAHGKTGHAARDEGVNALYIAIEDIQKIRDFKFPKKSEMLGDIKVSVTQIEGGHQHNVVPEECRFVADIRTTDAYSNEETAAIIGALMKSDSKPRSTRVWASAIDKKHPLVLTAISLGGIPFVSPTTSDMSLLHNIPSLKIGPGKSSRSHSADEYIELDELKAGLDYYDIFLNKLNDFLK